MQNSDPPAGEAGCRILKKGFTLIELLVVMAIIGILAALALTSFNTAQKNSRDTRRKSDLQQYRNALEAYASNNQGKYPTVNDASYDRTAPANAIFSSTGNPIVPDYLPSIIDDPINEPCPDCFEYVYDPYGNDGQGFSLRAHLETGKYWEICSNGQAGKVETLGGPGGRFQDECCVGDVASCGT